jgi:hypothetical protein
MTDTELFEIDGETGGGFYDLKELDREALRGAKAYGELRRQAGHDWNRWEATIIGLAALRDMAFAKTGNRNKRSQAYRSAMSDLLQRPKYHVYAEMRNEDRSACYKLMDHIEEISAWHAGLDPAQKLAWTHPLTMIKHVPEALLSVDPKHNQEKPKRAAVKKQKALSGEARALAALIMELIQIVIKYEPETAFKMLPRVQQLLGEGVPDPEDSLEGVFGDEEEAA